MYSLAIYIYAFGALIASLFNKKVRKMIIGMPQAYIHLKKHIKPSDRVVWFHAASLGEFEQGRPLMERLRKEHPEYKILLTFFSPSGYEVRKQYEGADLVCYLPFDTPGNVKSFVRLAHPEIAIFIKYEFWTNYLTYLKRHNIKVYSVSSIFRPGQHFFKWWGSLKPLKCFDHLFVQNEQSKILLEQHGITNTTVVGDTRLDRVLDIRNASVPLENVKIFVNQKPCFIAGSSWGPDEEIYIPYFANHKDWKIIIAPHVISESHIKDIMELLKGRRTVRYTEIERRLQNETAGNEDAINKIHDELRNAEVMLIDCFGKLSSIYRYGQIAIVGGGFGVGIHNVPEAAVYGVPVLFGPNNKKFQEAQALLKLGGSFEYSDADSFARLMNRFISDRQFLEEAGEKAGNYINSNAGATDKCFNHIFERN